MLILILRWCLSGGLGSVLCLFCGWIPCPWHTPGLHHCEQPWNGAIWCVFWLNTQQQLMLPKGTRVWAGWFYCSVSRKAKHRNVQFSSINHIWRQNPRKCYFLPRKSTIKKSIRKLSVQARMSSGIHLVITRGEKPVGKSSDNRFFKSHLYLVLEFFSRLIFVNHVLLKWY